MKINILLILIFLALHGVSFAGNNDGIRMYNQANDLYRSEKYSEALHIYEELIFSGEKDPDILYNASNASYKSGSLWKSVLYLERYLKFKPYDTDAISNLKFINSIKQDKEIENGLFSTVYNSIPLYTVKFWSAIFFAAGVLFLTFVITFRRYRIMTMSLSVFSFCLFIVITGITINKSVQLNTIQAVINKSVAPAYSGPGENNTIIFELHEGTKITIERSQDSWILIRLKSGAGGWMHKENLVKI